MPALTTRLIPVFFVGLWSTGFIGAKLGLPYAEPFTFLTLRFLIVLAILVPWAVAVGVRWPTPRVAGHMAVTGLLVHGAYLGGVFAAIDRGLPAGLAALIVGLQPLVTAALVGPLLGERVSPRQWFGILLGLFGVVLVVSEKIDWADPAVLFAGFDGWAMVLVLLALAGITLGTLYQKRFGGGQDLRAATAVQYAAAGLATGAVALAVETREVVWSGDFIFALGWLVIVLSIGAVSLLMMLIRSGAAAATASLFYLVPPVTATIAFLLFGETLGPAALVGMALAAIGVGIVVRPAREVPAR